jgi:hypothetical protein
MIPHLIKHAPLLALIACMPRTMAPPAAPSREAPAVDRALVPPVPGTGQVILDTVDGPADVEDILSSSFAYSTNGNAAFGQQTARVCTTPCVANLGYGEHELKFRLRSDPDRVSSAFITATTTPTIHRYAVGTHHRHPGGTFGGIMLATVGGTLGFVGVAVGGGTDNGALVGAGVGGLALGVLGLVLMSSSRDEIQSGTLTSWPAE